MLNCLGFHFFFFALRSCYSCYLLLYQPDFGTIATVDYAMATAFPLPSDPLSITCPLTQLGIVSLLG